MGFRGTEGRVGRGRKESREPLMMEVKEKAIVDYDGIEWAVLEQSIWHGGVVARKPGRAG